MTTIRTRIHLSAAARAELVDFCAENLKDGYDAERYAAGLIEEADFSDGAGFEIRGFHTKDGNPVTTGFYNDSDFVWANYDEETGEQID